MTAVPQPDDVQLIRTGDTEMTIEWTDQAKDEKAFEVYRRLEDRDWVKIATRLEPDVSRHAAYEPYYGVYRRLYENAKEELHELARLGQADGST